MAHGDLSVEDRKIIDDEQDSRKYISSNRRREKESKTTLKRLC